MRPIKYMMWELLNSLERFNTINGRQSKSTTTGKCTGTPCSVLGRIWEAEPASFLMMMVHEVPKSAQTLDYERGIELYTKTFRFPWTLWSCTTPLSIEAYASSWSIKCGMIQSQRVGMVAEESYEFSVRPVCHLFKESSFSTRSNVFDAEEER